MIYAPEGFEPVTSAFGERSRIPAAADRRSAGGRGSHRGQQGGPRRNWRTRYIHDRSSGRECDICPHGEASPQASGGRIGAQSSAEVVELSSAFPEARHSDAALEFSLGKRDTRPNDRPPFQISPVGRRGGSRTNHKKDASRRLMKKVAKGCELATDEESAVSS
jgi:hypothetical protein